MRWLRHHSALEKNDAIFIGAKTIEQLKGNVIDCRKGPLAEDLRLAVEDMWESAKDVIKEANWR